MFGYCPHHSASTVIGVNPRNVGSRMIGKQGRVTGRIAPGLVGEVMIQVRGGSEAFHAYSATPGQEISTGSLVIVVDHQAPRTVYVELMLSAT
jgi:hypothetical protein